MGSVFAQKTSKSNEISEGSGFDMFSLQPLLRLATAYAYLPGPLYRLYVAFLLFLLVVVMGLCFGAMVLLSDMELKADAVHNFLAILFVFINLITARIYSKEIISSRNTILSGFYHYQEEDLDEESRRIIESGTIRSRIATRNYGILMMIAVLLNLFIFTGIQALLTTQEEYERFADTCNPYLPLCMALPFSTRDFFGWFMGYLVNAWSVIFTYGISQTNLVIFVTIAINLAAQLTYLNHSILHIFERAERMLKKSSVLSYSISELVHLPEFQACLNKCLKANIEHHQLLIRYQNSSKKFISATVLTITVVSAFGIGSRLYLCMQNLSIGKLITYAAVFSIEQNYGLFLCYYGQNVLDESSRLFESLSTIPWYDANKSFNSMLRIFMLKTKDPMKLKVLSFNLIASMETYGELISAIYKSANILRQSDRIHQD